MVCFFGNINYKVDFFQTFVAIPTNFVKYISRSQLEKYFLFLFLLSGFLKTLNMVNHAKRVFGAQQTSQKRKYLPFMPVVRSFAMLNVHFSSFNLDLFYF